MAGNTIYHRTSTRKEFSEELNKSGQSIYSNYTPIKWADVKAGDRVWIDNFEGGKKPLANPVIGGPFLVVDPNGRRLQSLLGKRKRHTFMHVLDNLLIYKSEGEDKPEAPTEEKSKAPVIKKTKVDWRYALETKAVALRSAAGIPFRHSIIAGMVRSGRYKPLKSVDDPLTLEQERVVQEAVRLFRQLLVRSEPIVVSGEIFNYIESMMLSEVDEFTRLTSNISTDYAINNRLSDKLLNVKPPKLTEEMIPSGFIVFDGSVELGLEPNSIAVVALQYQETFHGHDEEHGILITIYLDPRKSGYLYPEYVGRLVVCNIPIWSYTKTFEQYLTMIDNDSILGGPRYVDRIPNILLFNYVHGFVYCLLQYLRERTHIVKQPDNTKKVQIQARKLNLEPKVSIVLWRKEADNKPRDPDHVPGEVEWSCRWSVKEHKRTYHRGKSNEFTITIKSYIKGPEHLPLKAPNIIVNAAVR